MNWIEEIQGEVNDCCIESWEGFEEETLRWMTVLYLGNERAYDLALNLDTGDHNGLPDAVLGIFADEDDGPGYLADAFRAAMINKAKEAIEQMFVTEELDYWTDEVNDTGNAYKQGE